jgi:hypothetical protein
MLAYTHERSPWRLLCFVLCLAVSAQASDSRRFAGFYQSEQLSEQGDLLQVKLSLQVFNYSHAEVRNAIVFLADPLLDPLPGVIT